MIVQSQLDENTYVRYTKIANLDDDDHHDDDDDEENEDDDDDDDWIARKRRKRERITFSQLVILTKQYRVTPRIRFSAFFAYILVFVDIANDIFSVPCHLWGTLLIYMYIYMYTYGM